MVEYRAFLVRLRKLIIYILKLYAFAVFSPADMTNTVAVHLPIRDCLLCGFLFAVAFGASDCGGNLILLCAGELTVWYLRLCFLYR